MPTHFEQLESALKTGGVDVAVDHLIETLRDQGKYHELFEALKMRVRRSLDLPITYSDHGDDLANDRRERLEDGLLAACREVGTLLLADGRVREGWMYLRPVGDKKAVLEQLEKIEANDDNLDELVEVCLHEGLDISRGYGLVLDHHGTCNAITTFESLAYNLGRELQQAPAGQLLRHLYDELTATVSADIAHHQGSDPDETSLHDLIVNRDWLFAEHSYHVDTTHLAAVVRFARVLEDESLLRLALELTEYGRRLNSQFQLQGDEPFADIYTSHGLYFKAILGEDEDAAVDYFRERAANLVIEEQGSAAAEVYIALLARLGRCDEAIAATLELIPQGVHTQGIAPDLMALSEKAGNYVKLLELCREREDLLGYATGLLQSEIRNVAE